LAPLSVELGMLYSKPSVAEALGRLRESGAQRILVLPLFPQYCGATTARSTIRSMKELRRWRWLPELRFVSEYHDDPAYVDALRGSVAQHWEAHGRSSTCSYRSNGIPERSFHQGDPYFCKCQRPPGLPPTS